MHADGGASLPQVLAALIAILVAAKLLGELAERFGQPAVLGELVAGVLLGPSLLGLVDPQSPIIHAFAEIGAVLLLFQIGLETDLGKLLRAGPAASIVAVVGVVLPFVGGYFVARLFGIASLPSIVIGATLTATSVGITARVLSDLGRLEDTEGQIILGAAVIDDVLGLIILAVVSPLVAGSAITAMSIATVTALAFGFLLVAIVGGKIVLPPLFRLLARIGRPESLAIMAIALAFVLALTAQAVGSAMIVGAFAAGLVLRPLPQHHDIESGVTPIARFFVPIFFCSVGAAVDARVLGDSQALGLGAALLAVALIGKFLAGFAPFWLRVDKVVIGVGMIPRGEVGLIFARMGLTATVLTAPMFGSLMMVVMITTLLAPPLLKRVLPPDPAGPEPHLGISQLTTEA